MPTKILSVDDSRTIRRLVVKAFQPYDCTVCEAGNGEEGLVAAAKEKPDLILLDVTMPGMDGVTMLTTLKANPDLKAIPVIMLTAESGRDNVLQIARLGVRDYLVKPFKDDQLIEKAGRVVPLAKKAAAAAPAVAPKAKPAGAPVDMGSFQELSRLYNLPPIPESVLHLTKMVASQDADLQAISQLIEKDAGLKTRLLRLANPGIVSPAEYTLQSVEDVLLRNGIGSALVLAMSTPLALALSKAFQAMLALKLETLDPSQTPPAQGEQLYGNIGFAGKAVGNVTLLLNVPSAVLIASKILKLDAKALTNESPEVSDAIGELLNIITGNFKSNLCDAGLDCRLMPPTVSRSPEDAAGNGARGLRERMAFRSGSILLFVDVTVDPWSSA